ncbi:polysaccharide biosynthesis protein [Litoribaculum gwangyangense]|uniref:Polysaccharide biosynthesis protein n=1 Tax=Litoribaculum gwangyangense TaxID=1130722 RepID=A0ABP9CWJ7_9FLAO
MLPYGDKIMYWGKAVFITGFAQMVVQVVGFLSGILVIRLLPIQEYALYTLANTMLGTMAILSDGGISTGVTAEGGKVWKDPEKLGVVLATGLDLRRKFAIGSLMISIPILFYLLVDNGASWLSSVLIVLSLIPAFYAALSNSLLEIAPTLHQSILPLQKNEMVVGLGRLGLTALTLFIFPWTFVAILASGIPGIYGNIQLKKISRNFVDKTALPDALIRKKILKVVSGVLPGAIYYSLSGQITIWLISVFGNVTSVAQLGAIGRLVVVLTLFSSVFFTLLVPRFTRLEADANLLMKRFLITLGLLILVCITVTALFWIFSYQILWVLGDSYSNLNEELILFIVGSCAGLLTGIIFSMSSSRGWILNPYLYISLSIVTIITGIMFFNIATLKGILIFNIYVNAVQAVIYLIYTFLKIQKQ